MNWMYNIGGKPAGISFWRKGMILSSLALLAGVVCLIPLFSKGLGVLPLSNSLFWGVLIANFVFWIGIGHAGTFISAILLLLNRKWRNGINRFAEAMTLIAIILAALMPVFHLGKPGEFYRILPFSTNTGYFLLNFNSPLSWDFYAIATYFIVSFFFFYAGLLPDIGRLRDLHYPENKLLSWFSLGWVGSASQWRNHTRFLYILAGIATVLVVSVHSIVSYDFAVSLHLGWHSAIFPVYFVIGAILSGFAMVCILAALIIKIRDLGEFIRIIHFENMSKIMLGTSILIAYIYLNEIFMSFYSGNPFEITSIAHKLSGGGAFIYYLSLVLSIGFPQLFWIKKYRKRIKTVVLISVSVCMGMWLERFMIIVSSSEISFTGIYPLINQFTWLAAGMVLFGIGFFFTLILLFVRFFPVLSMHELQKENILHA